MTFLGVYDLIVPEEPPEETVILTADSRAFQRWGSEWFEANNYGTRASWPKLLVDHRPLSLIYLGPKGKK